MPQFAYHSHFDTREGERFRTMPLFVLGINHNTAPVEIREKVAFDPDDIPAVLSDLKAADGVSEVMVLSTCNRTEIIGDGDDQAPGWLRSWLGERLRLDAAVNDALFELRGLEAARHLFRVASGLDSVILGEPQIAGQLKDSYRTASSHGTTGQTLDRACSSAFSTAKRVRTQTAIGENPVSVAYAAVSLAQRLIDRFNRHTAVLIGAGDTIELVARHLSAARIGQLFVANRSLDNATSVARRNNGIGLSLAELDNVLHEADIIVSSTASPEPVVSQARMRAALARRRRRQPVFIADIAVPRDIEPTVAELDDIYLYTVDDLQGVISENLEARREAAVDAEKLIEDSLNRFAAAQRTLSAVPLIKSLRGRSETLRDEVLDEARRRLAQKGPEEALDYLAHTLTNKLLHTPSESLRRAAGEQDQRLLDAARALYRLDDDQS